MLNTENYIMKKIEKSTYGSHPKTGAEVNVGGIKDEQTALHKVARYVGANEQIKCAQLLLEHGADINHQDKQGNTVRGLLIY